MNNNVKELFIKEADKFSERRYYNPSLLDKIFRKSIFGRFKAVLSECSALNYHSVLDVGCGAGIQALQIAAKGLKVLGIDFSDAMIAKAKQAKSNYQKPIQLDFICADFLEYQFSSTFDIVIALGFFDYVPQAEAYLYLMKMQNLAKKEVMVSFPAEENILSLQRKIRYKFFKKCPVYFYRKKFLTELAEKCVFYKYNIECIHRDYLLKGFTSK